MHKPSVPLIFLALFTSAERAAEIEGDLLEQRRVNGSLWFVTHMVLTAFALFRQTLMQQPLLVLLPGYAVYELLVKWHLWAIRPALIHLRYELDYPLEPLIASRSIWIVTGYLLGFMLVRYLPKTGIHTAIVAVTLGMARALLLNEVSSVSVLVFLVVPVLLGAFHAGNRNLSRHGATGNPASG
jgi:hypothetical protein